MCSLSGFKQGKENTNDLSKGISCANQYREEPAPFLKQLHLILINYQLKPTITEWSLGTVGPELYSWHLGSRYQASTA